MNTRLKLPALLALMLATALGCQEQRVAGPASLTTETSSLAHVLQDGEFEDPCASPLLLPLVSPTGEQIGRATLWNGETMAYVQLEAQGGWEFIEIRAHGARRPQQFPRTRGVVNPSRFQFGGLLVPATAEVLIEALHLGNPYGVEMGDEVLISIFARLRPIDTDIAVEVWAEGTPFRSSQHAMYFRYTVQDCEAPPPPRDPVVIRDATFMDDDCEIFQEFSTRGGEHTAGQSTADGNPPPHRLMRHFMPVTGEFDVDGNPLPSTINVRHRFIRPGAQYDPAALGRIDRMDFRMDRRVLFVSAGGGGAVGHAFLVFQNGVTYWADLGSFTSTSWETRELLALTADDFTNSAGQHPAFSELGSPLTFGYLRSNSNTGQGAHVEILHGIDNWEVTIHR